MARRKRSRGRSRFSSSKRGSFRRRAKSAAIGSAPLIAAGLYGAARVDLANLVAPLSARIPLGGIADEVGMLLANMAAKKFIPFKTVKNMASAGMMIEAAAIGAALRAGGFGGLTGNNSNAGGFVPTVG